MHTVTLKKVTGGHNVRTDITIGQCEHLPKIGESFSIVAEPLVEGSIARFVTTSDVQEIIPTDTGMIIKTLNSTYSVEIEKNIAGKVFTDTH